MSMSTTARGRKSDDFDDRIRTVKSLMRLLLQEAVETSGAGKFDADKGIDFFDAVKQYETELIETALDLTNGRQRDAAKLLNLGTSTLCTKIKRLNIPVHARHP